MPDTLPQPEPGGRLAVIAAGKAAGAMMKAAEARGDFTGLAVTRYGHLPAGWVPRPGIELIEAGHPEPDENSLRAGLRALEIASALGQKDRLLLLLSGGGSALLAAPAPGLTLADKQALTRRLLASGATITEINCVRRHVSRVKGGRLAAAAAPARVTNWIISDIPGDDPAAVASGPGLADLSIPSDALAILSRYGIAPLVALSAPSVAPPAHPPRTDFPLLATASTALEAASDLAEAQGWPVTLLGDALQGEARTLARTHARLALEAAAKGRRRLFLSGGEATIRLGNSTEKGGRNLEYLLSLAIALQGAPGITALACDTDGIDGTTPSAGAHLRPDILARAAALGLNPAGHLEAHKSHPFFEALGDLVITGPTLTNVNDFRAIAVDAAR